MNDVTTTPSKRGAWYRFLGHAALALAAGMALYALAGYALLPKIVQTRLAQFATRELARTTTIERVELSPFKLAAAIHGIAIADASEGLPLLRVERVDLDLSAASLWKWAPVVESLRITRPRLAIARIAANRYSIQDLIDRALSFPPGPPPPFSVNNIELVDGSVDFDDRPQRRKHRVEHLEAGIPFLSSLAYETAIKVQPKLAGTVNGVAFTLAGDTTPFAKTREAAFDLDIDRLPLPQYLDYSPTKLAVELAGGYLTTRLRISFAQPAGASPTFFIAGEAILDELAIVRRDKAPLIGAQTVAATIDRVDPAARTVAIARLAIARPEVTVRRRSDGAFELADGIVEASVPNTQASQPWRIEARELAVTEGSVHFDDASVAPAYRATYSKLSAQATRLSNAARAKAQLEGSFSVDESGSATVSAEIGINPVSARGRFDVKGARLARLYPYVASLVAVEVQRGVADVGMAFDLATSPGFELKFSEGGATLSDVTLAAPGDRLPMWHMPELLLEGFAVDVNQRMLSIGSATVRKPILRLRRDAHGEWNYARMLRTTQATGVASESRAPAAKGDGTWQVLTRRTAIEQGEVVLDDSVPQPAVTLRLSEFNASGDNIGNARDRRGTIKVSTRTGDGGRLTLAGPFVANPPSGVFDVDAKSLSFKVLRPYIEGRSNVILRDGRLAAKGRLEFATGTDAPSLAWNGDVTLSDVAAIDGPTAGDLFKWRTLALTGLVAKGSPVDVAVAKIELADFYARVIVLPDGTLNLQHLGEPEEGESAAASLAAAPAPGRARAPGRGASDTASAATTGESGGRAARAAAAAQTTLRNLSDGALPFAVGRIDLSGGNVNFTDNYVRPNYSANLTQLGGGVSAMSPTQAGDIAITAKLDNGAPVEIRGRLQPFARELVLDLEGSARDIELPPLSPYSAKYAGYGITKGKLAFDVSYKLENRRLEARNRIVLDQLTFGERVESPDATKLPVLLAVALLKDTSGKIDIQLPIAGTLDDPQFSLGGLIVRVIVNLLTKAATAPFALLAAAFGGGEELSQIDFAPGSGTLSAEAAGKLDKLGQALANRPALKVEITGWVDPAGDRAGLEQAALDRMLRSAKFKALSGTAEAPESIEGTHIAPDERARWLLAAYRNAPIKERPRNVAGLLKEVPLAEMEALLKAHADIGDQQLADLGLRRAQLAQDALTQRGVAGERIFLVAPKATPGAREAAGSRVMFALR